MSKSCLYNVVNSITPMLLGRKSSTQYIHYEALSHDFSVIRCKVFFNHAGFPCEGDIITLKADLVRPV